MSNIKIAQENIIKVFLSEAKSTRYIKGDQNTKKLMKSKNFIHSRVDEDLIFC